MLRVLVLSAVLAPAMALAHLDDEELPPNADEIVLPAELPLLEVLRFTRMEHRLVLSRLQNGDRHVVAGLTGLLAEAFVFAGEISPRPTARLLFQMSELKEREARLAHLAERAAVMSEVLAELRVNPNADPIDLDTVRALLALVHLWQRDPMAGL